ncbi:hypothetical protein A2U01_0016958 [Trifolium medium]|uniref:Uncharacterized protein n=1 Tax=Trifolium medium TaxID=97028 RepID=A0A392NA16_9FABA|nr:hypothetical protein [Trifolium medium]
MHAQEAEWNREIEIFLQQLEDGLEEAPEVVEKLPELKELPPKWKYVFLGGDPKKPIVISSLLTSLEEEELLKEAKMMNDGFRGDLDGMIPIYCLLTPKKNEDFSPVVQSREVSISTLQVLMKDKSVRLDETDTMSTTSDNFRTSSVHVITKKENAKKPTKGAAKKKRNKRKEKEENPKSDPASVNLLLVDRNIAPRKEENKRSRVELKLKYPP